MIILIVLTSVMFYNQISLSVLIIIAYEFILTCPACLVHWTWIVLEMGGSWSFSSGLLHTDEQVLDAQLELTYSSSVQTQDVAWKTCWWRWMIEMSGEEESGKSMREAQHDDDSHYLLSGLFLVISWTPFYQPSAPSVILYFCDNSYLRIFSNHFHLFIS